MLVIDSGINQSINSSAMTVPSIRGNVHTLIQSENMASNPSVSFISPSASGILRLALSIVVDAIKSPTLYVCEDVRIRAYVLDPSTSTSPDEAGYYAPSHRCTLNNIGTSFLSLSLLNRQRIKDVISSRTAPNDLAKMLNIS
jgi:hypothetical protein